MRADRYRSEVYGIDVSSIDMSSPTCI